MPRKVRQIETDLKFAGFVVRPGKGSHRRWVHPATDVKMIVSGSAGDDAKPYQESELQVKLAESRAKGG